MRIAIPTLDDKFCGHFGKSDGLFLCELDIQTRKTQQPRLIKRQARGCESLPQWLADLAVDIVLAGGIGGCARDGLEQHGIDCSFGHNGDQPTDVLEQYLSNPNEERDNTCHGHEHGHDHHHCKH